MANNLYKVSTKNHRVSYKVYKLSPPPAPSLPHQGGRRHWRLLRQFEPREDTFIRGFLIIISLIVISFIMLSCQQKPGKLRGGKNLTVVTTLFPLYDFAKNIGGQKADVTLLLPPGVEPHAFEPRPGDILKIHEADMFVYTGRFMEPWVEDILKGTTNQGPLVIDASRAIKLTEESAKDKQKNERGKVDPHIWLDFSNAKRMVANILDGFLNRDPSNKDFYLKNAEGYTKKLDELDRRFRDSLASCKKDIIIHGGHFAFGYLAKRYNLTYISAYKGFSPDAEPTPRNLISLTKKLKENDVKYVFYEELISPKVAEVIARETGARLLMLHGAHNVTRDDMDRGITFISLMEHNLDNLRTGLECP